MSETDSCRDLMSLRAGSNARFDGVLLIGIATKSAVP